MDTDYIAKHIWRIENYHKTEGMKEDSLYRIASNAGLTEQPVKLTPSERTQTKAFIARFKKGVNGKAALARKSNQW